MKRLLIITLLIGFFHGFGQANIPLKVSEKASQQAKYKAYNIKDVYPILGGGFWSISQDRVNYYITVFDDNFNKTKGGFIMFKFGGKYLHLENVQKFHGRYIAFLSYTNVKQKKKYLFYSEIEPEDLETTTECVKIAELKMGTKLTTSSVFDIRLSKDKKNILVLGIPPSKLKRNKRSFVQWLFGTGGSSSSSDEKSKSGYVKFSFWVLDKNLQIINHEHNHAIVIDEAGDKFFFEDFTLDNDGNIYILGKNQLVANLAGQGRKRSTKKFVDYEKSAYVLEQIMPNGDITQYTSPTGVLYNDMEMVVDSKGFINLVGLLAEQYKDDLLTTGVERLVLSPEGLEIENETSDVFTEEVLDVINNVSKIPAKKSKRTTKRRIKREARMTKEDKELAALLKRAARNMNFIAYLSLDENDNPVMVLEERYLRIVTTTRTDSKGNTTTTTTYYYHYNDLLVIRFDEDEVYQRGYLKSYVSVNYELDNPLDVSVDGEFMTISAQDKIIRTDEEVSDFASYEIKGIKPNKRRAVLITFRKVMSPKEMIFAQQRGRKITWIRTSIK